MNQTDAMGVAEDFLKQYTTNRPEYWDGDEPKVRCKCAAKGASEAAVYIIFSMPDGEDEEGPELVALATLAMAAMFDAHPELKEWDVTYDLSA
jgi:hypothetical protein